MWKHLIIPLFFAVTISAEFSLANAQAPGTSEPAASSSPSSEITELQKKAEAGDSSAAYALGHAYETGKAVRQNYQLAAFWYRNGAEWGNAAAQSSLGVLYWFGEGVDKDKKEAVNWYHKAARQGDANAMFNLGVAYYNGEGANVDDTLAYAWFMLASEAGSQAGRDAAKRSEAEHGKRNFGSACVAIGAMYEKGLELPLNLQLAIDWYKKAAQGEPGLDRSEAETRLISIFLNANNYSAARPWCEALAKEGRPGGAFCLGHLYQHGLGVGQDLKAAFRWYEQGAKGGSTAAMLALGRMYEDGQGTKIDRPEAFLQFLLAADHGDKGAAPEAIKARSLMDENEWKTTQKKLKERHFNLAKVNSFLQSGGMHPSK